MLLLVLLLLLVLQLGQQAGIRSIRKGSAQVRQGAAYLMVGVNVVRVGRMQRMVAGLAADLARVVGVGPVTAAAHVRHRLAVLCLLLLLLESARVRLLIRMMSRVPVVTSGAKVLARELILASMLLLLHNRHQGRHMRMAVAVRVPAVAAPTSGSAARTWADLVGGRRCRRRRGQQLVLITYGSGCI